MTNADFEFDEIGVWSEIKLEIVEKYGSAYTTAFANSPNLTKFYIDAFSGAGVHISKRDGSQIEGSPSRAWPAFTADDHPVNSAKIDFADGTY